jgi:hypothetical protein
MLLLLQLLLLRFDELPISSPNVGWSFRAWSSLDIFTGPGHFQIAEYYSAFQL